MNTSTQIIFLFFKNNFALKELKKIVWTLKDTNSYYLLIVDGHISIYSNSPEWTTFSQSSYN